MKKILPAIFSACFLTLSSTIAFAEHRVEDLSIDKVGIVDQFAIVTFSNADSSQPLNAQGGCVSTATEKQAVLDLDDSTTASYLYTHLMTAMVSKKSVHLLLDGCASVNEVENLPVITSVEIIN